MCKMLTSKEEYVTLLVLHFAGGSGGPMGRMVKTQGDPRPTLFVAQQKRFP